MVKTVETQAVIAALPVNYTNQDGTDEQDMPFVTEQIAAAVARLRRDLETYNSNQPALAYALAGETHAVTLQKWRFYAPEIQTSLLLGLMGEAADLLHQFQARIARIVPSNGYMFGLQDEVIKLETQADIILEEIRRIEDDLQTVGAGTGLQ